MTKIDTNIAALKSLHHLTRNEDDYSNAVERLSSGKRINNAGDDAAGASIVNRMTAQISGMKMAMRNAADAISMSQVAEGAMDEVSDILQRMRELGVQAANGTYSGADRVALNQEINQLKNELLRISETTSFNTTKLLNGTFQDTQFEIGFDETPQHTHTLTIKDMSPSALGMWEINSQLEKSVTLSSVAANGAAAIITTSADHDFAAGDIVAYEKGSSPIPGLIPGRNYKVGTANLAATTFTLTELDGTAITYGQLTVAGHGSGTGAKFHLSTLAGAPNVAETGGSAAGSNVLAAENLTIYGHVGTETANITVGSTGRDIAAAVNNITTSTGVTASAQTNARLTFTPNDISSGYKIVSFDLLGMNADAIKVTASIKLGSADGLNIADLSDLRDKISGISGNTDITATLSADGTYIDLFSPDGYDIVIDNFDFPMDSATAQTAASVSASGANANDTITTAAAHGFAVGDVVRLTSIHNSENTLAGLSLDTDYFIKTRTGTTFTLATGSHTGTTVDVTGTNAQALTFTKALKTMNVQTMDGDKNLKGFAVQLTDKELGSDETPNLADNMRITGEVTFRSSEVFTMVPADDESIFRDQPQSASLTKISEMNVLTIRSAQNMLAAIDGALLSVDAERGKLGATMNRMEHTIDNLSNIVMNTQQSKGRISDADMAAESVNLSKSQILRQAATAMLAQANQSMQSVLDLLR